MKKNDSDMAAGLNGRGGDGSTERNSGLESLNNGQNSHIPDAETLLVNELFPLEASAAGLSEPADFLSDQTSEAPLSIQDQVDPAELEHALAEEPETFKVFVDPDQKLTDAFLSGDQRASEQAFIQLYAKYEAPLLLYCKRMLSNDRIAEDAFQEIWIRVFELRTRGGVVIACFRALLFRSARNLCLNTLRLEKLRAGSSDMLMNMLSSDESSHQSEQREIKALIRQALNKLPFDQREAFVLHEYSGYSYAEIAVTMGTTEVNVKVRAYRARLRLRKLIQGWLGLGESDDPSNVI